MSKIQDLWNELVSQNPTNSDLRYVIECVEPLRAEAGRQLLAQKPTNGDLRYVIRYVEPLRAEATKMLSRTREEIMRDIRQLT